MSLIPDDVIERLKAEVSAVLLAERAGVALRPVGEELVGRCPFPPHVDSTPSLSIHAGRNVWQCFGCGIGGTSIDWVMHEKGLEFRPAVELMLREFFPTLAAELLDGRGPSPAVAPGAAPDPSRPRPTRRSRAPELACPFDLSPTVEDQTTLNEYVDSCAALFSQRAEPQDYVRKRGLDLAEMVQTFRFGYQDRSLGLMLPMGDTKAGREIRERFQRLGLLRPSGHAAFNGSLLIPTIDLPGNVTGIYGRKTRDDLNKSASPKHLYLRGRDADVFNEAAFVAGKEIVLCESRIDALSFWRHDIRNVTACRGVHLSDALFDAFVRYGIERCLIAFDRDDPGDAGAEKAAERLMGAGVDCYRVQLPRGMDVNEISLQRTPASKHLDLFLRSAEWMGNGRPPRGGVFVSASAGDSGHVSSAAPSAPEAPPSAPEAARPAESPKTEDEAACGPAEAAEEGDDGAAEEGSGSKPASGAASASPVDRFPQAGACSDAVLGNVEATRASVEASPRACDSVGGPSDASPAPDEKPGRATEERKQRADGGLSPDQPVPAEEPSSRPSAPFPPLSRLGPAPKPVPAVIVPAPGSAAAAAAVAPASPAVAPVTTPRALRPTAAPACPAPSARGSVVAFPAPVVFPLAPSPPEGDGLLDLQDDSALFAFNDRRYRVRGLARCRAYGSLKINLKAERQGPSFEPPSPIAGWHMDNLDLCAHRPRQIFEKIAAHELGVREELIRFELGRVLTVLEAVQEQRIAEAAKPKVKTVTLTEKETEEAIAFWKSADLFTRIADDYTKCGLVGELTNKIATYIGATSRLLVRPLAIIIQSSSAAGKSTLMEKTLAFMPEEMREKYTAVSGKSLFYLDEGTVLSHKILAIVEEEGAEKATYPLKILNSEGELVMASTGKDPATGKLVTKIYRVEGPVMILLTTTSVEIDPELENRCLRLTVDESREQTKAIHEIQRMAMTYEGHVLEAERESIQRLHQNAQRLLRRIRVHNPYSKHLTFVSDQTRMRRDHAKYLVLMETIALMHQLQRPVYRREIRGVSEEYLDVTLDDVELAGKLIGEIVGQNLSDLPAQTIVFLNVLDEMVRRLREEHGVPRCDLRFSQRQIRELTGWRDFQVRFHLGRLLGLEYVLQHKGSRGHSYVYELVYNGEGKDGRSFVLGLVDVAKLRRQEAEPPAKETRPVPGSTQEKERVTPAPSEAPAPAVDVTPGAAGVPAEPSAGVESPATTFPPRGPEGRFEGYSRPIRDPFESHSRALPTMPEPAPQAALLDSEGKTARNAQLPPARRPRSYAAVVPTGAGRNGHGFLRINLLRRPAITLRGRAGLSADA